MPSNPLGLGTNWDQKRMSTEADTCRECVVPKLQAAGWENMAEIIGKFGSADQLRNAANQLQSLLYAM
jgi:type I site-specific restriction endonuclease